MANTAPFLGSFFFQDTSGYGWTEGFHFNTDKGYTGWATFFDTIAVLRMKLSPPSVQCPRFRVQSVNSRAPYVNLPTPGTPYPGTATGDQLPADDAILIRWRSSQGYYNRTYLRGVPEEQISGEKLTIDSTYSTNLQAWIDAIVADGAVCVVSSLATTNTHYPIAYLAHATPKGINMTVGAATSIPIGTKLVIHNAGVVGYNGQKTVVSGPTPSTTGNVYLLSGANPKVDCPADTQAYYTIPVKQMYVVANGAPEKVSDRKAGRPFGLSRGRGETNYSLRQ